MFAYIARQAILNKNKELYAYERLFRDGENNCFQVFSPDEATSKILTDGHLDIGFEDIPVGNPVLFIFTKKTYCNVFQLHLTPNK
jgi:EAL and modified HD-GYP domain-containing signal transduction protein